MSDIICTLTPVLESTAITPPLTIKLGSYQDTFDDKVGGDGDVQGTPLMTPDGAAIIASYMRMNTTLVPGSGATTLTYDGSTGASREFDIIFGLKPADAEKDNFYIQFDGQYIKDNFTVFEIMDFVPEVLATGRTAAKPASYGSQLKYDLINDTITGSYAGDYNVVDTINDGRVKFEYQYYGENGVWIKFTPNVITGGDPADPIVFSSSATFSVQENQTSVGTVQASGGDGTALIFSITGGADSAKFGINSSSGVLTFNSAPDFETPGSNAGTNAYAIIVTATDGTTTVTQNITVNITDVAEDTTAPVITLTGASTINLTVGDDYKDDGATATDNVDETVTVIVGGTVNTAAAGTYTVTYNAEDAAGNKAIQVTRTVIVSAPDDTTNPVITSLETGINLAENSGAGQLIYTITATDNVAVTGYAIGGTDAGLLTVNATSGVVTLNANPNFENKSSYSFNVTASDAAGNTSNSKIITFSISDANDPTTGIPAITSTGSVSSPLVGDILTATRGNIADQDGLGVFSYQWKRNGANIGGESNIAGAINQTYTIQQSDKDYTITVSVNFTDIGNNSVGPLTSSTTGAVTIQNYPATGRPTITGVVSEGNTLTANSGNIADQNGLGSFSYQWKSNDANISGATNSTYTLGSGDVGKTITVLLSFIDSAGNNESRSSIATAIVTSSNSSVGGVDVSDITSAIPVIGNSAFDSETDTITVPTPNTEVIKEGTTVENRARRTAFINNLLKKQFITEHPTSKIVMNVADLFGEDEILSDTKNKVVIAKTATFNSSTLASNEGLYVVMDTENTTISITTTKNTTLKIEKVGVEYNIYENTSTVTKTKNEGDSEVYDNFKYTLGSVTGETVTWSQGFIDNLNTGQWGVEEVVYLASHLSDPTQFPPK
jgi:hypothetical protein